MKKIVPMFLVMLLALVASGCVGKSLSDTSVSAASLLKVNNKPDNFSLIKAQGQNQAAVEFADSKEDIMEGDSFLTYVEAAKIADEASRPLTPVSSSSGNNAGMPYAVANAAGAVANQLQSSFTDLFSSMGTLGSSVTSSTGIFNIGGLTTPATSSNGGQSSGGTTSSTIDASSSTPAVDPDHQTLMNYYADFQSYQQVVDPIISQAGANPWSARDLLIDDQTLVNLLSSSHTIFDFIRNHPSVTDGDTVLAAVGDVLSSINSLWGVGRNEAQAAFLMINLYYPGGSYIAHAQEGLAFL